MIAVEKTSERGDEKDSESVGCVRARLALVIMNMYREINFPLLSFFSSTSGGSMKMTGDTNDPGKRQRSSVGLQK